MKQTTWFTKGLRQRDSFYLSIIVIKETNDLIYEGIATLHGSWTLRLDFFLKQTTWFTKGLRPCCHSALFLPCSYETNDLIYEGIATLPSSWKKLFRGTGETNDLIYEGIATSCTPSFLAFFSDTKQTTWFTKGLRLPHLRSYFRRICFWETNDLIYEGIATILFSFNSFTKFWNKRPDLRRDCDLQ